MRVFWVQHLTPPLLLWRGQEGSRSLTSPDIVSLNSDKGGDFRKKALRNLIQFSPPVLETSWFLWLLIAESPLSHLVIKQFTAHKRPNTTQTISDGVRTRTQDIIVFNQKYASVCYISVTFYKLIGNVETKISQ